MRRARVKRNLHGEQIEYQTNLMLNSRQLERTIRNPPVEICLISERRLFSSFGVYM